MMNIEAEGITKNILEALYKRKEIYDILMGFKTRECSEEERESFIQLHYIVRDAEKDTTTITHFDEVLKQSGMNVNAEMKKSYPY